MYYFVVFVHQSLISQFSNVLDLLVFDVVKPLDVHVLRARRLHLCAGLESARAMNH